MYKPKKTSVNGSKAHNKSGRHLHEPPKWLDIESIEVINTDSDLINQYDKVKYKKKR